MTPEHQWLLKEKYAGIASPAYQADLVRLEAGEPLAYLIGHVPFLNTTITLDSRPLIPRAETEYWMEYAIDEMHRANRPLLILDLCAGSGAIGIAALAALPHAHVDFVEIDSQHHRTIDTNIRTNSIDPARATLFGGDLFSDIPSGRQYDYILSNPPYIDPARAERVATSVTAHEPHQALFGGEGGMALITQILQRAPLYLAPRGVLYLEHEPEQAEQIQKHAAIHRYTSCESHQDQYGVLRFSRLCV